MTHFIFVFYLNTFVNTCNSVQQKNVFKSEESFEMNQFIPFITKKCDHFYLLDVEDRQHEKKNEYFLEQKKNIDSVQNINRVHRGKIYILYGYRNLIGFFSITTKSRRSLEYSQSSKNSDLFFSNSNISQDLHHIEFLYFQNFDLDLNIYLNPHISRSDNIQFFDICEQSKIKNVSHQISTSSKKIDYKVNHITDPIVNYSIFEWKLDIYSSEKSMGVVSNRGPPNVELDLTSSFYEYILKDSKNMKMNLPNHKFDSNSSIISDYNHNIQDSFSCGASVVGNSFNLDRIFGDENYKIKNQKKHEVQLGEYHYKKIKFLGHGSFGFVYLSYDASCHRYVAIKIMPRIYSTETENSVNEIKLHQNLVHNNVIKLYKSDFCDFYRYLILEYVPYTLESFVKDRINFKNLIFQILNGLEYIHSQNIVHNDLKLSNILVSKDMIVKIADFGLSFSFNQKKIILPTQLGSLHYCSPEKLVNSKILDHKIDIYSIGIIIYFLYTGEKLISEKNKEDQYLKQNKLLKPKQKLIEIISEKIHSPNIIHLIVGCCRFKAKDRITLQQAKNLILG